MEPASTTAIGSKASAKPSATRRARSRRASRNPGGAVWAHRSHQGWTTTRRGRGPFMTGRSRGDLLLVVDLVRGDEPTVGIGDGGDDPLERLAPARVHLGLAHLRDD